MRHPKSILITGASSGIGRALALAYAARDVHLTLTGRDLTRLDAVAKACELKGAAVRSATIDVTDKAFMAEWLVTVDRMTPIDLAVANAGISGGSAGLDGAESDQQVRRIFAVNLDGVLNTIGPLLPRMAERGHGQLALMSSLASFKAFPGAPAYCAAKAAVRFYGEALRGVMKPAGVEITVICPGHVRSPMTEVNDFRMPFLMDTDKAARLIMRRLAKGHGRIAFPFPSYLGARILECLPIWAVEPLIARAPRKAPLGRRAG